MRLKNFLIVTLILFLFNRINAQSIIYDSVGLFKNKDYIIRGNLYDTLLNKNIVCADILVWKTKIAVKVNLSGDFNLKLPRKYLYKKFKLFIYAIGYDTRKIRINNKSGKALTNLKLILKQHDFSKDPNVIVD